MKECVYDDLARTDIDPRYKPVDLNTNMWDMQEASGIIDILKTLPHYNDPAYYPTDQGKLKKQ